MIFTQRWSLVILTWKSCDRFNVVTNMTIDQYLTVDHYVPINVAAIVHELEWPKRLALISLICEGLETDESIEEIRKIVNASSFDDPQKK